MQRKRKIGLIAAIAVLLVVGAVAGQGFHLIWNQVPFEPNNYSWEEPWEVHEMVDFVDAQLTITGCSYEGQNHDIELIITNVANTPDYYLTAFSYLAKWYVSETEQENIIAGSYAGDPLPVDEFVTYVDTWLPTIFGVGVVKLNLIDIEWAQPEAITWIKDQSITGASASSFSITNYEITGATQSVIESGNVAFTIKSSDSLGPHTFSYKVEVVELGITIAEQTGVVIQALGSILYSFDFDPMPSGGDLTMLITITTV